MALIAYITLPEKDEAMNMAQILVDTHLAAGVHVDGPLMAVYRWRGQVCRREEWRLAVQLPRAAYKRLQEFVLERHPYQVPCIMAIELSAGYEPFLEWIEKAGE